MIVRSLHLENFRCFEHLELAFQEDLTVLFGWNGVGKTAVVDALALVLSNMIGNAPESLRDSDIRLTTVETSGAWVRQRAEAVEILVRAVDRGAETSCTLSKKKGRSSEGPVQSPSRRRLAKRSKDAVPPLLAVYRAGRAWSGESRPERDGDNGSEGHANALDAGYAGALDAGRELSGLRSWWRQQDHMRARGLPSPALEAVEIAVQQSIQGCDAPPEFAPELDDIIVKTEHGRFSLGELSDGQRGVVSLVADVARRAALLAEAWETGSFDLQAATGVVLVDEIDLHLHPEWQRRVLRTLAQVFPKIQFIVTTHAPAVLGSVANRQVKLFTPQGVSDRVQHVEDRDVNSIVSEVMNLGSRTKRGEQYVRELYDAIEEGELDHARTLLARLRERWGDLDVEVLRATSFLEEELGS